VESRNRGGGSRRNYGRISVNGSNGYGTVAAPGTDPLVITVGAMKAMGSYSRTDDQIASYSSKGPTTYDHVVKPDVVAPGNLVVSTDSRGSTLETLFPNNAVAGNTSLHDYLSLSGTSMATPAVAGGVALMLQQNPNFTPDQVKARLMKTAYKTFPTYSIATDPATGLTYLSFYDVFTVGAGYVDLGAALSNTDVASGNVGAALSPTATYNSRTGMVTVSNGNGTVASSSWYGARRSCGAHPWFGARTCRAVRWRGAARWFGVAAPPQDLASCGDRRLTRPVAWSGALRQIPTGHFPRPTRKNNFPCLCVSRNLLRSCALKPF
jgi:serine protease AprX